MLVSLPCSYYRGDPLKCFLKGLFDIRSVSDSVVWGNLGRSRQGTGVRYIASMPIILIPLSGSVGWHTCSFMMEFCGVCAAMLECVVANLVIILVAPIKNITRRVTQLLTRYVGRSRAQHAKESFFQITSIARHSFAKA